MKIATTVGYWSSGPPGDAAQLFTTADELGLDRMAATLGRRWHGGVRGPPT